MQSGASQPQLHPVSKPGNAIKFRPLLDRFSVLTRILVPTIIGTLFGWIQYWTLGIKDRSHFWWLLAVIIASAAMLFCYATAVFRASLSEMCSKTDSPEGTDYFREIQRLLDEKQFLGAGLIFGFLNLLIGLLFGIPYSGTLAKVVTAAGFFLVGFTCGMPVQGIYGVTRIVEAFAAEPKLRLDYTDPDGCAGLRFLAGALVRFSSVTLVAGVLVAWYVLHTPWTHAQTPIVQGTFIFWVTFPFFLSLLVLLVPAFGISARLKAYKLEQSTRLQSSIETLRQEFESSGHDAHRHASLEKIYDYNLKLRMELHEMRTWPYNLNSGMKYSSVFLVNAGAALVNANDQWEFVMKLWQKVRH